MMASWPLDRMCGQQSSVLLRCRQGAPRTRKRRDRRASVSRVCDPLGDLLCRSGQAGGTKDQVGQARGIAARKRKCLADHHPPPSAASKHIAPACNTVPERQTALALRSACDGWMDGRQSERASHQPPRDATHEISVCANLPLHSFWRLQFHQQAAWKRVDRLAARLARQGRVERSTHSAVLETKAANC